MNPLFKKYLIAENLEKLDYSTKSAVCCKFDGKI